MGLESCSRRAGISVHDALETLTTMSRNMRFRQRGAEAAPKRSLVARPIRDWYPTCPKSPSRQDKS
jgi:hypothetical protein